MYDKIVSPSYDNWNIKKANIQKTANVVLDNKKMHTIQIYLYLGDTFGL